MTLNFVQRPKPLIRSSCYISFGGYVFAQINFGANSSVTFSSDVFSRLYFVRLRFRSLRFVWLPALVFTWHLRQRRAPPPVPAESKGQCLLAHLRTPSVTFQQTTAALPGGELHLSVLSDLSVSAGRTTFCIMSVFSKDKCASYQCHH